MFLSVQNHIRLILQFICDKYSFAPLLPAAFRPNKDLSLVVTKRLSIVHDLRNSSGKVLIERGRLINKRIETFKIMTEREEKTLHENLHLFGSLSMG